MSDAKLNLVIGVTDRASGALGKISDALGSVGRVAGGLALGGIAAVGGGLLAAAGSGLSFNNTLEQTTAKMIAFTGSQEGAAKVLDMVRERAAKTPFAFNEMADAAAAFLPLSKQTGVALESYIEQAEVLAALNPAEGLAGAAFALREAAGGDFLSIIERFNLPKKRLMELKDQGVPALEAVKIALKEMGVDASLVAGLGETMSGRWSTFQDTLQGLAATATSGLFEGMKGGLVGLQGYLDANNERFTALATTVGEKLGTAFSWLINTGVPALIGAWQTIQPVLMTVTGLVRDGLGVALSWLAQNVLPLIQQGFDWITSTGLPALQGAFETVWPLIQQAIATVYQFVSQVVIPYYKQNFEILQTTVLPSLQKAFDEVWPKIQAAVEAVYLWLSGTFFPWIQDVAIPWIAETGLPALRTAFETVWPLIEAAVRTVYQFFRDTVWPWLSEALRNTTEKEIPAIKEAFETAWPKIRDAVMTAYTWFKDTAWPWLSENFANLRTWLEEVEARFNELWPKIQNAVAVVYGYFKDTVWPWLQTALANIKTWIDTAQAGWSTAWGLISGAVTSAKNTISGVIETIKSLVQGAIDKINALISLINNIPGVNLPSIPTAPTGSSGFGGRSVGDMTPLALPRLSSTPGQHITVMVDARNATDPRAVADNVERAINRVIGQRADLRLRTT